MTDDEMATARAIRVAKAMLATWPPNRPGRPDEAAVIAALLKSPRPSRPAPAASAPCDGRLLIRTHLYRHGSYGLIAEHIGRGLETLGVPVAYSPITRSEEYFPLNDWVASRVAGNLDAFDAEMLLDVPIGGPVPARKCVWFSMWEVDRLPHLAAARFNQCVRVVVPCSWNATVWAASGVNRDLIRVVPLGVDHPAGFTPDTPPPADRFVVGMAGRLSHGGVRKNLIAGRRAFVEALGDAEDACLRMRIFKDDLPQLAGIEPHDRVEVDTRPMLVAAMARWTKGLSVLLVPSRGEGFGLHTAEALACGRPVIAAFATGTADVVDDSCGWRLAYEWERAGEVLDTQEIFRHYRAGRWAAPTHESMVARLREAYDDWKSGGVRLAAKGEAGARRASAWTWESTARRLLVVLHEAGLVPMPAVAAASAPLVDAIAACPDRRDGESCCGGVVHTCGKGRGRGERSLVGTIECARCALAGYLEPSILPDLVPFGMEAV